METSRLEPPESASEYVQYVSLEQINPPKWDVRTRREKNEGFVRELKKDISENGLIEPVILRSISQIRYEVVAGVHRVGACADLEYEKIPARILDLNDAEAMSLALRENNMRHGMTSFEKARVASRLKHLHDKSWNEIAKMTGLSEGYCRKLHRVKQRLPDPLYTKWKKGIVSFNTAYKALTENSGVDPNPKQDFFTGRRVNDYDTIRVSKDTKGDLEAMKRDIHALSKIATQNEINLFFFEGDNNLTKQVKETFDGYGVDFVTAWHDILIRKLKEDY